MENKYYIYINNTTRVIVTTNYQRITLTFLDKLAAEIDKQMGGVNQQLIRRELDRINGLGGILKIESIKDNVRYITTSGDGYCYNTPTENVIFVNVMQGGH